MAVSVGDRDPGHIQFLPEIDALTKYTLRILQNEKRFPKKWRWLISAPIAKECVLVYACIRRANACHVHTHEDYIYRHSQQVEAHSRLEALLGLMDVAYVTLNIDSKKIEYWTGLVLSTDKKVVAWIDSDTNRYSHLS